MTTGKKNLIDGIMRSYIIEAISKEIINKPILSKEKQVKQELLVEDELGRFNPSSK